MVPIFATGTILHNVDIYYENLRVSSFCDGGRRCWNGKAANGLFLADSFIMVHIVPLLEMARDKNSCKAEIMSPFYFISHLNQFHFHISRSIRTVVCFPSGGEMVGSSVTLPFWRHHFKAANKLTLSSGHVSVNLSFDSGWVRRNICSQKSLPRAKSVDPSKSNSIGWIASSLSLKSPKRRVMLDIDRSEIF